MSNMVVRTNTLALNSHRNLGMVGNNQSRASARLSSGFRINSAADDAAGLGISEKMRAQIRGLNQASRNAQDGISLIQTAEGAMSTVNEMVVRIRELVIQASNDTNVGGTGSDSDRIRIQDEINQLIQEIDATTNRTEFNTRTLLNGDLGTRNIAINADFTVDGGNSLFSLTANGANFDGITNGANAIDAAAATAAENAMNDALRRLVGDDNTTAGAAPAVADVHAWLNQFGIDTSGAPVIGNLQQLLASASTDSGVIAARQSLISAMNVVNVESHLQGVDSLWFQIGANMNQGVNMNINAVDTARLGLGNGEGVSAINVLDVNGENIQRQISIMDNALASSTAERSRLGAMQNRLEFTIENLDISSENLSAAESRIRDADMALEMMRLTQANILQQAATAMLAQANQAPQSILQLLG